MIHHITITTLHHSSPTYSGIDQQEAFPTMCILMLVAVLTLTKIIEIPTLSPRKFAPLAYFDKYICRRLVASQAVLLARVLLVSMAVGGGGVGLHRDFFCAHSAATIPIPCKPTARFYFHPTLCTVRPALRLSRNPQFRNPT